MLPRAGLTWLGRVTSELNLVDGADSVVYRCWSLIVKEMSSIKPAKLLYDVVAGPLPVPLRLQHFLRAHQA